MNTIPDNLEDLRPDAEDISYGPHERNVFDLFQAPGDGPHPLLVYIHGGGFRNGDKTRISRQLFGLCLRRGISVISISYRLSQHAIYPAPFHDSRRALQFVRHTAADWNIDPARVAAAGSSAGAGMSFWLGFRRDMADPSAGDPVLHESTRLRCVLTYEGQTSYDPRFVERVVGGGHMHPALPQLFGVPEAVWPELDAAAVARVEDGAAINFLDASAPPVLAIYQRENRPPTAGDDDNFGIHHPRFGFDLKEKMDAFGLDCTIVNNPAMAGNADATLDAHIQAADFLARHLNA